MGGCVGRTYLAGRTGVKSGCHCCIQATNLILRGDWKEEKDERRIQGGRNGKGKPSINGWGCTYHSK